MISNSNRRRTATVLSVLAMVAILFMAMPGGVAATEHTQILDGDDEDVIEDFDASDDEYIEYELDADGADFGEDGVEEVYLNITYDDDEHFDYSADVEDDDESYTFNLSEEDIETLPGDATEMTEAEFNAWTTDDEGDTVAEESFDVDVEFSEERSTVYLADEDDFETVEEFDSGLVSLDTVTFWSESEGPDTFGLDDDVGIYGDETDIHVFVADSAESDFEETAEDFDTSGTPLLTHTSTLDGDFVPLYYGEEADWQDNESSYGVYDDGEVVISVGEEFEDEDETVDVEYVNADAFDDAVAADIEFGDVTDAVDTDEVELSEFRQAFGTDMGILNWAQSLVPFVGGVLVGLSAVVVARPARSED